jgi:hypothetical protein
VKKRWREADYFLAPFIPLAAWLYLLWDTTGNLLGDSGFAHYNVAYSLHLSGSPRHECAVSITCSSRTSGGSDRSRWCLAGAACAGCLRQGVDGRGSFAVLHTGTMCVFGGAAMPQRPRHGRICRARHA